MNDIKAIDSKDYHASTDREMLCLAYGAIKVMSTQSGNEILKILEEYLFPKPIFISAETSLSAIKAEKK